MTLLIRPVPLAIYPVPLAIYPVLLTLLALFLVAPLGAAAQTNRLLEPVPAVTDETAASDVEAIVSQAEKDGATVVIVRPKAAAAVPEPTDTMRAERFLEARERLRHILASGATLLPAMRETVERVSARQTIEAAGGMIPVRGDYAWLVWALATVSIGLALAWAVVRPVRRWAARTFGGGRHVPPRDRADTAKVLLGRALVALAISLLHFGVILAVAVVDDTGFEPTRRLIFEIALAWFVYRVARYAVSWNLTAYDAPLHRLLKISDRQARSVHDGWWQGAALVLAVGVVVAWFAKIGTRPPYGALTRDHASLLFIVLVGVATVVLAILVIWNRDAIRSAVAPSTSDGLLSSFRRMLAPVLPVLLVLYGLVAFAAFVFRLALGTTTPSATLVAPFLAAYAALVASGLVLVIVQLFYRRHARLRDTRAQAEYERSLEIHRRQLEAMRDDLAEGEAMVTPPPEPPRPYEPLLRSFVENAALAIIWVVALGELGRAWGVDVAAPSNWWASALDIVLAAALAWIAYRAVCTFVDRRLEDEGGPAVAGEPGDEGGAGASRAATLLPIFRWVLVSVIVAVALMVILSEFGVDIGPLIAGAGVVGIAVGFGAQKLIQDVFSGAFFLLDDAFRRGEYVEIEGVKGTVEKISIRSFQLRHHLGALHTLPFGEIRQLTNYSRDWVLMKLPLRVTYDTDVEQVRKAVKRLGQELLDDPVVGHTFLQPLKSQGVYKMEDSAMIIRVKFMTKPGEQFVTRKVVYERIQELFAREGIRFAHKEVTVRLADGEPVENLSEERKKAVTAAAREVVDAEEAQGGMAVAEDR